MTTIAELPPGFVDKVLSAQSTFRSVMDAMARPGSVQRIVPMAGAPDTMMRGTAAIALTLFDHDTPLWLDARMAESPELVKWLKFHTGAPVVQDSSIASFALISDGGALPQLERFALGTSEYPDRSTTLILQVDSLDAGRSFELRGLASTASRCSMRRSSRSICSSACTSTRRCFRAASMWCWSPMTHWSRFPAPRASRAREARSMYVAVKGGERAIENAHRLLADKRRGDQNVPEVTLDQISEQLGLAVDRVMSEGSLYDRELAALAIKQARGDLIEAIFPGSRLPRHLAPFRCERAGGHRCDAGAAASVLDLQGHSGRPDPRADLRLHPPPARSRARARLRAGGAGNG